MDLTLDYNVELLPLEVEQAFALVLATSLARDAEPGDPNAENIEDKDRDVWRPDGKGRQGLDEDYDYVMYGKARLYLDKRLPGLGKFLTIHINVRTLRIQVYRFDGGAGDVVCGLDLLSRASSVLTCLLLIF